MEGRTENPLKERGTTQSPDAGPPSAECGRGVTPEAWLASKALLRPLCTSLSLLG